MFSQTEISAHQSQRHKKRKHTQFRSSSLAPPNSNTPRKQKYKNTQSKQSAHSFNMYTCTQTYGFCGLCKHSHTSYTHTLSGFYSLVSPHTKWSCKTAGRYYFGLFLVRSVPYFTVSSGGVFVFIIPQRDKLCSEQCLPSYTRHYVALQSWQRSVYECVWTLYI